MNKTKKAKRIDIKALPGDIVRLFLFILIPFFRIKKYGVDGKRIKYKPSGNKILAVNHSSFVDPLRMNAMFPTRRLYYLTAEAVMRNKLLKILMSGLGCIRVDRNIADIESIRKCETVLNSGRVLVIFPAGAIDREGNVGSAKSGASLLSVTTNSAIIPIYTGKRKHWYKPTVSVIGDPIDPKDITAKKFPSVSELNALSELLSERLEVCKQTFEKLNK